MDERQIRAATPEQLCVLVATEMEKDGWPGEWDMDKTVTLRNPGEILSFTIVPDWPGDIAAAWALTDPFDAVTVQRDNDVTEAFRRCRCSLSMSGIGNWMATGETVGIAICRAVLLARLEDNK